MSVSGIRQVFELSQKLKNPLNLSIGKPDFPIPENIKKVAQKAIQENKNDYSLTFGLPELRQAVAKKLRQKNKIKQATAQNTIITSAVSGGLTVVLPTLINPGDEVILFDPYFVGYKQLILLFNGIPKIVPKNDDFSLNIQALRQAITSKTKVIIINTPENPTGHIWNKKELQQLASLAKKHNIPVIADEIYEDFIYDNHRHISLSSIYKNTITLGGFSKSHAMTGWRIGWLNAPTEIIQEIMKVQQYTFVCPPTPFQYAGLEALRTDISPFVDRYEKRAKLIYQGLQKRYSLTSPQGAFYFFIKYPYNPQKFIQDCLAHNLLLIPGEVFSEKNTHFRLSFVAPQSDLKQAIKILNNLAVPLSI
jgi:aspartate aminotransferase/aminotransferase